MLYHPDLCNFRSAPKYETAAEPIPCRKHLYQPPCEDRNGTNWPRHQSRLGKQSSSRQHPYLIPCKRGIAHDLRMTESTRVNVSGTNGHCTQKGTELPSHLRHQLEILRLCSLTGTHSRLYTGGSILLCIHADMDPEEQVRFLAPTREQLASVTVFPLIPCLKEDATVSAKALLRMSYCLRRCLDDYRYAISRRFKYGTGRIWCRT